MQTRCQQSNEHRRRSRRVLPLLGLVGAGAIAAGARRAHALTTGGAVAATAVGAAVVAGTGLRGGATLIGFFVSSSLLGRLPPRSALVQRRGNQRDVVQVLANGGVASVLALAAACATRRQRRVLHAGFGGAVATAAADTWATEIGSRWGGTPRSIVTLEPVLAGASGGVSLPGLVAAAAGATAMAALLGMEPSPRRTDAPILVAATAAGGMVGAVVDSVLGAVVQEVRICPVCAEETELSIHRCGHPTSHQRGAAWCNNDVVNLASTAAGAAIAMVVAASLGAQSCRGVPPDGHVTVGRCH